MKADIVTHYVWRGQDKTGLSIQPRLEASWKNLSFNVYGSAGLDETDYQELNLGLSYRLGHFNIGVTDYWQTGIDYENRYLYYDSHEGAHQYEANVGFTCKTFSLQAYTMFGGNDFKLNGERAYSTYIELGIPFKFCGLDWDTKIGLTPMESAGQWEILSRYTREFGVRDVNTRVYKYAKNIACCVSSLRCTKEFSFGIIQMPVFTEIDFNPYLSRGTLLCGLSIIFNHGASSDHFSK